MRTSDPDIYAIGDCAEVTNVVTGQPAYVPLGSTATKQGARGGRHHVRRGGRRSPACSGTTVCKVFDYTWPAAA